jgi:hypothetical protein
LVVQPLVTIIPQTAVATGLTRSALSAAAPATAVDVVTGRAEDIIKALANPANVSSTARYVIEQNQCRNPVSPLSAVETAVQILSAYAQSRSGAFQQSSVPRRMKELKRLSTGWNICNCPADSE